jgi:hypothetical protein
MVIGALNAPVQRIQYCESPQGEISRRTEQWGYCRLGMARRGRCVLPGLAGQSDEMVELERQRYSEIHTFVGPLSVHVCGGDRYEDIGVIAWRSCTL